MEQSLWFSIALVFIRCYAALVVLLVAVLVVFSPFHSVRRWISLKISAPFLPLMSFGRIQIKNILMFCVLVWKVGIMQSKWMWVSFRRCHRFYSRIIHYLVERRLIFIYSWYIHTYIYMRRYVFGYLAVAINFYGYISKVMLRDKLNASPYCPFSANL